MTGPRRGLQYSSHGTSYDIEDSQTPCASRPDLWFGDEREQAEAATICRTQCDLREQCLRIAIDEGHLYGTWGGITEKDRGGSRPSRAGQPRPSARMAPTPRAGCGTPSGYRNHYKHFEDPCPDCLDARRAAQEANRQTARERAEKRRANRTPPPCGTRAGYDHHRAIGEPYCDACRNYRREARREELRAMRKGRPEDALVAEVQHLVSVGADIHQAARATERSTEALERALQRRGLHDLVAKLKRAA